VPHVEVDAAVIAVPAQLELMAQELRRLVVGAIGMLVVLAIFPYRH
jgi:hypothetical protein